jgi:hypothetical protein
MKIRNIYNYNRSAVLSSVPSVGEHRNIPRGYLSSKLQIAFTQATH